MVGKTPVTKTAIASHLGISRTAVSLVLNNAENSTVSEETKEKILRAANELGYKNGRVIKKICYVLCDREITDPRYMLSLQNIERYAGSSGYNIIFLSIKPTTEGIAKLQSLLQNDEVEGYILNGNITDNVMHVIQNSKAPFVLYGFVAREGLDIILVDIERVFYEATKYVIGYGHRKIALLTGLLSLTVHQSTYRGYAKALEENGIVIDKSLIQVSNDEDGYELVSRMRILGIDYTALVCANSIIQFRALQCLKDNGICVPGRISLIGGNISEFTKLSNPKLTAFYCDETGIAQRAIQKLLGRINGTDTACAESDDLKFSEGNTVSYCG